MRNIELFLSGLQKLCAKHNAEFGDDNFISISIDGKEEFSGVLGHDKSYKITDTGLNDLCKPGPLGLIEIEGDR